jgi:hypothetical protein
MCEPFVNVVKPRIEGVSYQCPCCGFLTLWERGGDDICPVCFWEDDGQDENDADTVRGGPNHDLSLTQARKNYISTGACEERFLKNLRPPKTGEHVRSSRGIEMDPVPQR